MDVHLNQLTRAIIGAAIEVHRSLGPGLLESAYQSCLCRELDVRGVSFERERPLPVEYKGIRLECGYRLDLLVGNAVVVEVKSVDALAPIHESQLLTYLRLGGWQLGLLINFKVQVLKHGIRRKVLNFDERSTLCASAVNLSSSTPARRLMNCLHTDSLAQQARSTATLLPAFAVWSCCSSRPSRSARESVRCGVASRCS
jgi:GxxExxY protein